MQNFNEEEDVFFDSFECLSLDEGEFGYDIWLNGLHSVKERREKFMSKMGPSQFTYGDSEPMVSERLHEYSGAVSSSSSPIVGGDEDLICDGRRDCTTDANCSVDDISYVPAMKTKKGKWWKPILHKMRITNSNVPKQSCKSGNVLKVHSNRKRLMELTALYTGQEISAHMGIIWAMKFSPDGQYLASGGEDGVVRIWRVLSVHASEFLSHHHGCSRSHTLAEIPEKVFKIKESPVHEFHGHTSGVLDLAWSSSNCLLSSSKDNTVRLWKVGCDECLGVFHHNNYVTCVQFNPVDEGVFISGCIDGKVRVWCVAEKRVADWADIHDMATAICYHPNGKGFTVGSISGVCRFYEKGSELSLDAEIHFGGKRRSNSNIITGIQFLSKDSQKIMVTSGDSKIRILDGHDVVSKYRGMAKSGSQMSAALTPTGKHVISVGEDSRVYLWNYEDTSSRETNQVKTERSCEHFISEGASVAIPWFGQGQTKVDSSSEQDATPMALDSERFSLGNCFSIDISSRGSVTWPEEVLPLSDVAMAENENNDHDCCEDGCRQLLQSNKAHLPNSILTSPAWGLVIVTAGWDGKIRTFHNYGLPVRI